MSGNQNQQPKDPPNAFKVKRGEGIEAKKMREHLQGFDAYNSFVYAVITHIFGNANFHFLKRIATIISQHAHIYLDRSAQRDKRALIKWYYINWPFVCFYMQFISFYDSDGNQIRF